MEVNNMSIKFPHQLFINNQFVDASDGGTFNTINPTTEEVICKVAKGTKQDVDTAVNAAEVKIYWCRYCCLRKNFHSFIHLFINQCCKIKACPSVHDRHLCGRSGNLVYCLLGMYNKLLEKYSPRNIFLTFRLSSVWFCHILITESFLWRRMGKNECQRQRNSYVQVKF